MAESHSSDSCYEPKRTFWWCHRKLFDFSLSVLLYSVVFIQLYRGMWQNINICISTRIYTHIGILHSQLQLSSSIVLNPIWVCFPVGDYMCGGWFKCFTLVLCIWSVYEYKLVYVCVHAHTHISEGITPNLAVLSFEANLFEATYLQSLGFILTFNVGKTWYQYSAQMF